MKYLVLGFFVSMLILSCSDEKKDQQTSNEAPADSLKIDSLNDEEIVDNTPKTPEEVEFQEDVEKIKEEGLKEIPEVEESKIEPYLKEKQALINGYVDGEIDPFDVLEKDKNLKRKYQTLLDNLSNEDKIKVEELEKKLAEAVQ